MLLKNQLMNLNKLINLINNRCIIGVIWNVFVYVNERKIPKNINPCKITLYQHLWPPEKSSQRVICWWWQNMMLNATLQTVLWPS